MGGSFLFWSPSSVPQKLSLQQSLSRPFAFQVPQYFIVLYHNLRWEEAFCFGHHRVFPKSYLCNNHFLGHLLFRYPIILSSSIIICDGRKLFVLVTIECSPKAISATITFSAICFSGTPLFYRPLS